MKITVDIKTKFLFLMEKERSAHGCSFDEQMDHALSLYAVECAREKEAHDPLSLCENMD